MRAAQRPTPIAPRRPLDRKPKQLADEPVLFQVAHGPGGMTLIGGGADKTGDAPPGSSGTGITDEEAADTAQPGGPERRDPEAYRLARQVAQNLSIRRPRRRSATDRRGAGALRSAPYRGGSDDVDLDRTIEVLAERPIPEDTDIIVRDRVRTLRSVVIAIDVSGSMRGERLRSAAATVGALAGELRDDQLAVIAFWSDAAVLLPMGSPVQPATLLDDLLQMPARGLTNVAFPLELARRELAAASGRDKRVVLLTDAVHNAGPDPRPAAAALSRVDVLLDMAGEKDELLGREIATAGHGMLWRIRSHRDVAPALVRSFAT